MKRAAIASFYMVLLMLLAFGSAADLQAQDEPPQTATLIVKMASGVSQAEAQALIQARGGTLKSSIPQLGMYVVEVLASDSHAIAEALRLDPKVVRVEENRERQVSAIPSDTFFSSQWSLPKIKWDEVYGNIAPGMYVNVAVLDTGVDALHPDLSGAIGTGVSMIDSSEGRTDQNGHGTWVSGIIAAQTNNADGVAGVAFSHVRILPVKVLNESGLGQDADIINGVLWAADHGASVILMAFSNPGYSASLQDAITYAWDRGIVLVAAAGNDGVNTPTFPAGDKSVVGVTATDQNDVLAPGSNFGASVFMAAPGVNIVSTYKGGGYVTWSGNSASAAMVAGAAAFMRAVNPSLSNGAIVGRLARNADPAGTQFETGNGRLQMFRAITDTLTDEVQPAGAPPEGNGGPFVGPYRAAAPNKVMTYTKAGAGSGIVSFQRISGTDDPDTATGGCTVSGNTATCTASGTFKFKNNDAYRITATAAGSIFTGWSGQGGGDLTVANCGGTTNPCPSAAGSIVLNQDATLTANFGQATTVTSISAPTITYNANGNVTVTVTSSGGTVTGNVTLSVDSGSSVAKALSSGSATFTNADISGLASPAAGDHPLSASFAAQGTFLGSSETGNLHVNKASSTTTVTCPASVGYTGVAQTPCTVTVTGAGGLSLTPTPSYTNNVNAGTATASYTYAGDANHTGSNDSEDFTIGKASTTTVVTCAAGPHVYTGSPITPCTVAVTGAGGLNLSPAANYANNTNVGTATASYTYAGDANYTGSNDSKNFTIDKAPTTTVVTCAAGLHVYTGSPITPCTVAVTGANLSLTPAASYANNTDAGTATASYTYTGDANHTGSNDSENFAIDKAPTTTVVTCAAGPHVYTGSPITPCTVAVTGANLSLTPTATYTDNTNAGTATASYTYPGDANHTGSNDSENFTIDKAPPTTVVSCAAGPHVYTGSPITPCTVAVTGANLSLTPTANYTNNTDAGTATASYTYAGDANHTGSNDSENFTIDKAPTTTVVSCAAGPHVYTGSPIAPCTVAVTGANLSLTPTAYYTDNTNAGTATASYTYPGDVNHTGSNDSENFTIDKAPTTTVVTCATGPHVYTGSPITPCTVAVTGANLSLTPTANYANNTDAGTATASYTYPGDANHTGSNDSENFTIDKAPTTTVVTCLAGPHVYTGSAITPCTVAVTGANLSLTPTANYANNTDAGTATASYTYPGDANHTGSNDSENFTIDKATATTVVTCLAGPHVYTGSPITPCSVTVTGANLSLTPAASYTDNTNAGTATASYTYPGDANHTGSNDSENFTIDKAPTTTVVTCAAGPHVYTGSPITPCTVTVTGANLSLTPAASYTDNTNAGTATASYTYPGDPNHTGSADTENFTIDKAPTTTVVTCATGPHVYTGSPITPCTVAVTGANLSLTPTANYANNTDAGTATASYTYAGDANHTGSNDSENFTIDKAPTTTVVTCLAGPHVYTGSPITPCSVTVAGANLSLTPPADYANNTNAGTATASYTYAGDANHTGSNDTENFTIDKAPTTTVVTCASGPHVYTGSPITPCTVAVTGANLSLTPAAGYTDNTNAGTATASYTYAGDPNHTGSADSKNFTIDKAPTTTVVSCTAGPHVYTGSPITPCSVTVTGASLSLTPTAVYTDNTNAGTATASYSYPGDANHTGSSDSENFTIDKAPTTTVVTCAAGPHVYTASPITPCSVTVTGANLSLTPPASYTSNTNAGTATASYTYAGDPNHTGSSDSKNFTIDQAPTTTVVTCAAGPHVYTGSPITPCSVTVTGASLSLTPPAVYTDNTNAGTATASYTYPGDANHTGSTDSKNFTIDKAPTTTVVSCTAGPHVYTGSPITPCSVTVTGASLSLTPPAVYTDSTNAGTATASYTYPGDPNHTGSSDSENFTIDQAPTTTVVTCAAGPHVYTGSSITPCSVTVTGANLSLTPAAGYASNTNAGTATASYTYPGDPNHTGSSDSENFTIDQAPTTTVVTCAAGPHVYTGSPITPCSVTVTGANLSLTPAAGYANNTNAGTATASYTYAGDPNHTGSADSKNFTIDPAPTTTVVTCAAGPHVYTGSPITPCTVAVTGASLSLTPPPSYTSNTNAGTATASYTYPGDANHTGSADSENFTIDPAPTTTVVTCAAGPHVYTGSPIMPCSVTVTGANLSLTPAAGYANNTNAGTATASYSHPGDANHTGSADSENFTIDPAPTTTVVTCAAGPHVYTGAPITPCTVTVTGANLSLTPAASYTNNTNAGTANASYTYAGGANHTGSTDSKNFTISKKALTVNNVIAHNKPFDHNTNAALTVSGAALVGVVPTDSITLSTAGVTGAFPTPNVGGPYPVTVSGLTIGGSNVGNYTLTSPTPTASITGWNVSGFLQPVGIPNTYPGMGPGVTSATIWNTIKGGQTVPLKFQIFTGVGGAEITNVSEVEGFLLWSLPCTPGIETPPVDVDFSTPGSTVLRYDGGSFIQNWQTPKGANKCYQVTMKAKDGTALTAYFKAK